MNKPKDLIHQLWEKSDERDNALSDWMLNNPRSPVRSFRYSEEYRNARLAFKQRINGRNKHGTD